MTPQVDVLLTAGQITEALRADVLAGLGAPSGQRALPPKWFYDERGSQLFEQITALPEYYPTRRERSILVARAEEVMEPGVSTLVELGSGTSDKTRLLLDAGMASSLREFVPFDVSEATLRAATVALSDRYPKLAVHAVAGDFDHHLSVVGEMGREGERLVVFLGGTIGNFEPAARAKFLSSLATTLAPGDQLLLGTDLVKDRRRLIAAYDDSAGVTAAFNRNVLAVIDRELGADFDPSGFDHVARWNDESEWIEMRLRAREGHVVTVSDLGLNVSFNAGEEILTEISAKFRPDRIAGELARAGFALEKWWTDAAGDFGLSLSRRM